jgi:hypothetical protein
MRKPRAAELIVYAAFVATTVWGVEMARRSTPIATVLANHRCREIGNATSWEQTQDVRAYWVRADFAKLQTEIKAALSGGPRADVADSWHEMSTSAAWCLFRGIVKPSMARQGYPAGPDESVSLMPGCIDLSQQATAPAAGPCGWCTLIYVRDKPGPSGLTLAVLRFRRLLHL